MIAKNLENLSLQIKLQEAMASPLGAALRRAATSSELIRRLMVKRTGRSMGYKSVYSSTDTNTKYETGSVRDFFFSRH